MKAIFCPKKEKIILKIFGWEKYPLTTISFGGFRGKISVLRHLEGFFEKSEESRPPLKLKKNGGLFSINFL